MKKLAWNYKMQIVISFLVSLRKQNELKNTGEEGNHLISRIKQNKLMKIDGQLSPQKLYIIGISLHEY